MSISPDTAVRQKPAVAVMIRSFTTPCCCYELDTNCMLPHARSCVPWKWSYHIRKCRQSVTPLSSIILCMLILLNRSHQVYLQRFPRALASGCQDGVLLADDLSKHPDLAFIVCPDFASDRVSIRCHEVCRQRPRHTPWTASHCFNEGSEAPAAAAARS